ncbi:PTS system N-acetylgalactosamine-specific EIIA component (Man family) [Volucribacter psittacicida]|uniref:PTS system N-acetylgalactosamine-specific EIIA component (Man family) n=1 Tax=Volucribacter psittacicida TaxID=203482 RepID=A0A4V2PB27_9PAST|nr:PTS galactosamine/N-acetylgalactosamine transporter subunit IIA [Volucribacter psittacicida]TCJ95865.1 PTS system N-acetylgalactosamine-specific EIIA component (Man family) [Volucribacter psittacicida]
MLGIVVSGHIHFASGLQSAVEAIVGKQPQLAFVDFTEDLTTDQLEQKLREACAEVDTGDGVLFLTDLYGGSPTNRAANIILTTPNTELICGTNLSMIINAALEREELTLAELTEALLSGEMGHIKDMRKELASVMQDDQQDDGEGL